jgi:HNH endonuclease
MKLPDFTTSMHLNRLKAAMGIPRDKLGDLRAVRYRREKASRKEIEGLAGGGLEVDKGDVVPLSDGTLSYKDRRVLLYIRDVAQYGGNFSDPRFHFANCATVKKLRENMRFARFVIASREDGFFELRYVNANKQMDKRLDVCQNCLEELRFKNFRLGDPPHIRRAAVQSFSIAEFFILFPKTLHHSMPPHTDQTAPTNGYTSDFSIISRSYRQKKNWVCEVCAISLSKVPLQRYLHVHHINGQKNENQETNLKAVCVHCHAMEPFHEHVRAMLQYREFERIWHRWKQSGVCP